MSGLPYIPALKVEPHNSVFRGTRTSTTDDGYVPNGPRADADDSVGVPSPKLGSLLGVTEAFLGSWMGAASILWAHPEGQLCSHVPEGWTALLLESWGHQ